MGRVDYSADNGEWRLKIKAFAHSTVPLIGTAYGAEMESFQRVKGKWKKRKVPHLSLEVYYHGPTSDYGDHATWESLPNPKVGTGEKGDGEEPNDDEIEVADRNGYLPVPGAPHLTMTIKGVEAKGTARLPNGEYLKTRVVTDGELRYPLNLSDH